MGENLIRLRTYVQKKCIGNLLRNNEKPFQKVVIRLQWRLITYEKADSEKLRNSILRYQITS